MDSVNPSHSPRPPPSSSRIPGLPSPFHSSPIYYPPLPSSPPTSRRMAIPINADPYRNPTPEPFYTKKPSLFWRIPDDDFPIKQVIRPQSLQLLCSRTKFTRKELQAIYRLFKQRCPEGIITRRQMQRIFLEVFPGGNPRRFAEHVFRVFDREGSGEVKFDAFVVGLSIASRGNSVEKMNWIFDFFDTEGKDEIGFKELLKITGAIYELANKAAPRERIIRHALEIHAKMMASKNEEQQVEGIFCRSLSGRDLLSLAQQAEQGDKINRKKFILYCLQDERIIEALAERIL